MNLHFDATNAPSKEILTLIGIDKQGFINHVNKYLLEGMTKENFGKIWGLDHIVPVDLFDINDEAEKKLCYNYQNIIPMFNNDNRLKGASVHFSLAKLETICGYAIRNRYHVGNEVTVIKTMCRRPCTQMCTLGYV